MRDNKVWWYDTDFFFSWIFSIQRGLAIAIRTPTNYLICIDCGRSEEFSPYEDFILPYFIRQAADYKEYFEGVLQKSKIAQLFISHPHYDHIKEIRKYVTGFKGQKTRYSPVFLTGPNDNARMERDEVIDFSRIKIDETNKNALNAYRRETGFRSPPLRLIRPDDSKGDTGFDFDLGLYYVKPKWCGREYEKDDPKYVNSTSLLNYFRYGRNSVLFTGDITKEAIEQILKNTGDTERRYVRFSLGRESNNTDWHVGKSNPPPLQKILVASGLTALVAPHHGLKTGYPEALYEDIGVLPAIVLASEKTLKEAGSS